MTLYGFLAVGAGATLGAWLRWLLGIGLNPLLSNILLGTLMANLVGGYLIGIAVEYFLHHCFTSAQHSTKSITVPADIFCRRLHCHINSHFNWLLI